MMLISYFITRGINNKTQSCLTAMQ